MGNIQVTELINGTRLAWQRKGVALTDSTKYQDAGYQDAGADCQQRVEESPAFDRLSGLPSSAARMRMLFELTDAISRTSSLEGVYDQSLLSMEQAFGVTRSAVLIADQDNAMRFKAWRGLSQSYRQAVDGHSPWPKGEANPKPIWVEDVTRSPNLKEYLPVFRHENIVALAFIPLVFQQRLLGKFMLYYPQPHQFSPEETELAEVIAKQIAFAVQQKRSEQELQKAQTQLSLVLDTLVDGVTAQDSTGKLLFANRAAAFMTKSGSVKELLEATPEEIVKRFEILDEAGLPFPLDKLPGRVAIKTGQHNEAVVSFRVPGTSEQYSTLIKAAPAFDEDGRVVFAVNSFRDVTKEKELYAAEKAARHEAENARKRISFLAEASNVLSSSLDYRRTLKLIAKLAVPQIADWCIVDLVSGSEETPSETVISHSDPAKASLARKLRHRYPPSTRSPHGVGHVLHSGEPELYPEIDEELLRQRARSDHHLQILLRMELRSAIVVPIKIRKRTVGAITLVSTTRARSYDEKDLAMAQDLAQRSALAIDNARLYEEATRAVEARENFLATVCHDLRNPLGIIIMKNHLLRADLEKSGNLNHTSAFDSIHLAAKNMERLLSDLVDFASVNNSCFRVERGECKVKTVLHRVLELNRPLIGARELSVRIETKPSEKIFCDYDRMLQVFSNLIGNAIKYTSVSGKIIVKAKTQGNSVVFCVQDNGIGIRRNRAKKAFDRYWKGDKKSKIGLGLGLFITKALVQAHEGEIWLESAEGKGTSVFFTIPHPRHDTALAAGGNSLSV